MVSDGDGRCVLQPDSCVSDVVLTCCHCFVVWSVMAMDDVCCSLTAVCHPTGPSRQGDPFMICDGSINDI